MVRAASRVLLPLGTALAGALGMLVACGSFGAAESEAPPEAGSEAAVGVGDAGTTADAGLCAPRAFCDSFDDGTPLPRGWKAVVTSGAAKLAIVPGAGVGDTSALVATFVNDSLPQSALLPLDVGVNGPPSYDMVLAFSARVTTTGAGFVLGPRFLGNAPDGGSRDIFVDWHANMIRLDRYIPSCDGGCPVSKTDTPVDVGWHRYTLTVNARSATAPSYGNVKLEVDGNILVNEALTFSLSSPSKYGFQFGVSYATGNAGGSIAFDDVSLLVTAR